jgi:glycosyltransferase involved in cell wall biosynthesis
MKLLIVCDDDKIHDYSLFSNALFKFGIDTTCVRSYEYCFVSPAKVRGLIPSPKMLGLIKRINPDIILADIPYYTLHLSKLVNRFVILHLRYDVWSEADVDKNTLPSFYSRVYTGYLASIKETCIKKADLVLLNSHWLQSEFKKHLPNQLNNVLYVGTDSKEWVPCGSNKRLILKRPAVAGIFQLGEFHKVLGLISFTKVIKRMPDVNFYFAGSGPYLSMLEKYRPPNMFLLGKLKKPEVKALLESCDVFVHPAGLDALPRAVREASLLEKPIVASNVGGIPEIVRNNETGYLCEINNIDQWVEKIRFLLDNPNQANEFGKNAREYVLWKFDWERLAGDFVKTLCSLKGTF